MRRGIFGGSFDPVHNGHLVVAGAAADQLGLDVVHLVPANVQPFKDDSHAATAQQRLAMLRAAIEHHPRLIADPREIARGGTSYTVDTVREIAAEFPKDRLCLLIGADAAREFPDWKDPGAIGRLAQLAVLTRPGMELPAVTLGATLVTVPAVDVSATMIRDRVLRGESIDGLVPPAVAAYIEAHRLYRTGV